MKHRPVVTHLQDDDGNWEWGISFNGPTPDDRKYVPMPDKETAFKLRDLIVGMMEHNETTDA